MRRRVIRAVLALLLLTVLAAAGGGFWLYRELHASLPILEGRVTLPHLHLPVSVTRDALGIPTIRAQSREDVARVVGFLHAQDRFFQMDLARRRAAGELAELFGERALPVDRVTRLHRFRVTAKRTVARLPANERRMLAAYVEGVNAGLAQLNAPPFEYLMLRQTPRPWAEEDSFLVVLAMFFTLQDSEGFYDAANGTMRDVLPGEMVDFLVPRGSEWDSPIEGGPYAVPPIPGPEIFNQRARRAGKPDVVLPAPRVEFANGSNNFAVAGRLTATGLPLVANDMHLTVRVPNIWYRAAYIWGEPSGESHLVVGVSLPGHPAIVIGSNTQVAWGFTNSYGDFADVVNLEIDPRQPAHYRTPSGWQPFDHFDEVIKVAGADDQHVRVEWTIWGPVIDSDHRGRRRALRWVAHSLDQLDNTLTPFESARTLEELFDQSNGLAAPGQNMVAGDRTGWIGWTIFGAIPRRQGLDGDRPMSWADGTSGWNGWLDDHDYPRIIDPPNGRIWTANARVAGESAQRTLGHGNYEVGSRARIIRDRLQAIDRFTPRDLFDIQLDVSATFLERWRELLLRVLTPDALRQRAARSEFRDVVANQWSGKATADSAAYRLTREFRDRVSERVFGFLLADCYEQDRAFDYRAIRLREGSIWKVVTEQPVHLLDPAFATWQDLLVSSVDEVIDRLHQQDARPLDQRTWGEANVTAYQHPLSGALPLLDRWLNMPSQALDGDLYTPNMHWRSNAPSERMVVSPGRESEGLMQMPTGQSGHPLSPYYRNSHHAWAAGEPTALMPGTPEHLLTFQP